jgi:hypothetical protein
MLSTLPPKIDIRYAGTDALGFDVKLPKEADKLKGFSGTLISYGLKPGAKGIRVIVSNGKVIASEWIKPNGFRK